MMTIFTRLRWVSLAAAVGLMASAIGVLAPSASAETPATGLPVPVTANALPTWQINGVGWSQAVVGNTVYVAGSFTKARPPGVAVGGAGEIDAQNLFAYDITTGAPVGNFSHSLNAQGLVVRASVDGSRIYVGGDFTAVDGVARSHIAAFDVATGALLDWNPNVEGQVRALALTSNTVYVGGNFQSANGQPREHLAAFDTATRTMKSWAPAATGTGAYVWSMVMAPDNSRVIVGGSFSQLNGVDNYGMGSLDAVSGDILPWAANTKILTGGLNGAITSLKTDGTQIFGSGYAFGAGASFEGTFSADPTTGAINWINDCLGDTYDTFPMGQVLYAVSHSHNCSAINEFPDTNPRSRWQKTTAAPTSPTGTITVKDAYGWDYRGYSYAGLLHWYPDLDFGNYTPDRQAAWSVIGNGTYLALAGEFPKVNNTAQQGLVRFAYRGVAGGSQKPLYSAGLTPQASSVESGVVRVTWLSTWDRDDRRLTYDIYRDNGPSIATLTQDSLFWKLPALGFLDRNLTPGTTHTYKVRVKDGDGNVQWGLASNVVTVSAAAVPAYTQAIRTDGAAHLWRLGDAGPGAIDSVAFSDLTSASVTFGAGGAVPGDAAVTGGGGSTPKLATPGSENHPQATTVEAWVKTTSTSGGRIVGFGDATQSGTSANIDAVLYLANSGKVNFALNNGAWRSVQSNRAVNDGQWHHLVATADAAGVSLYVDGRLVGRDQAPVTMPTYQGYWRLLADQTSGLPNKPSNAGLAGSIDEVAVYPAALSRAQVQAHYLASGRSAAWPTATPADTYGAAVAASGPDLQWRLNEASGPTAYDTSSTGQDGNVVSGVTFGASSAVPSGTAAVFNGTNGLVVSKETRTNPTAYSTELWFSSTSKKGGKLIGFGNAATGTSSSYDRQVCLLNNGHVQFGAYDGSQQIAETAASYADGQWHHMVATQGADGMKLYLDSVLVATNPNTVAQNFVGYWRVGGDKCWGGTTSNFVGGTIDEVAVYPMVLTQDEVDQHYAASGRQLPNKLPTAAFTHAETYLGVTVDGTSSTDRDGTIVAYAWTFGDGATGSGATASHTYAAPGTYPITLTVTDDRGGQASTSGQVTVVANQAPTAAFTTSASFLGLSTDATSSSDADGEVVTYAWDFGDGSTGTGATATHTFASAGTYAVTLTITDNGGATATTSQPVTVVANQLPTPSFTASSTFMSVAVDASASTDPEGPIALYQWSFGDGATATGVSASHVYAAEGTYAVTLTVTDGAGDTALTSQSVVAVLPPNQLPTASFTQSAQFLVLSVDGRGSSDPDGTIVSSVWDFGDGASDNGSQASHTFAEAGTYTVTLTVTDNRGASVSTSTTVSVVANNPPTAAFTHAENFLVVSVNGSGSADAEGPIAAYAWDFGDGSTASGLTATHTYAGAGSFVVTLTVTDGAGSTSTSSATVAVAPNPAYASDAFERTTSNGWGTGDIGGVWSVVGTASRYSVAGGVGKVALAAGGTGTETLGAMTPRLDTETAVTFSLDKPLTGGGVYYSVIGRQTTATSDYRVKLKLAAGGVVTAYLTKTISGTETILATTTVTGWTFTTGDQVRMRMQVSGASPTQLSAKVWKVGAAEPSTWTITSSDNSAGLQSAGWVGLYSYVSGSATNAPVTFSSDDLWVGPLRP